MRRSSLLLNGVLVTLSTLLFAGCMNGNLVDAVSHGWGLGICGTIVVILDILAILEIVGSDRSFGKKAVWSLLIVFFPVGGLLLYWFFGK